LHLALAGVWRVFVRDRHLVLLGTGNIEAMIFVGAMLSGMIVFEILQRKIPSGK